ncbi:alpha-1,2-fucosyltransferase [Azospirillum sp. sgz301742]
MDIFLNVKGGVGNQLFQAALGIALEARLGATVHYIDSFFATDPYGRNFCLDRFPNLGARVVRDPSLYAGLPVFTEVKGGSIEDVAALATQHPALILDGYWQDERYFGDCRDRIMAAFALNAPEGYARKAAGLRERGTIGLHVRRYDYGHHGLARVEYYKICVQQIRNECGDVPVFICTDEYNFCAFEFRGLGNAELLKSDVTDPLGDFYLLSHCRHFVVANSSFSWWAAWLGETAESVIYTPHPWCVFDDALNPAPTRWRCIRNAVLPP